MTETPSIPSSEATINLEKDQTIFDYILRLTPTGTDCLRTAIDNLKSETDIRAFLNAYIMFHSLRNSENDKMTMKAHINRFLGYYNDNALEAKWRNILNTENPNLDQTIEGIRGLVYNQTTEIGK